MAFRGALAAKATNQTGINFTTGAKTIAFDSESYDTNAFHDTSVNAERLTIPAGVTRVRLLGQVTFANLDVNTPFGASILKNGANISPAVRMSDSVNVTNPRVNICSGEIDVTQGDYFTLVLDANNDASADIVATGTWFAIEEVAARTIPFSGALVKKSSDQLTANYTSLTAFAFDTEVYDLGGWHDNVSNNTRLTVPSGVSHVRLRGGLGTTLDAADQWYYMRFTKNGSVLAPAVDFTRSENSTGHLAILQSPVIPVSSGDYFETHFQNAADSSITVREAATWFSIEKVA